MFLRRKIVVSCVLMSAVVVVVIADSVARKTKLPPSGTISAEESRSRDSQHYDRNEQLFKELFSKRRREHLEAVRGLRKMENYERRYKMIVVLAEKVFHVIRTSRAVLESAGFEPSNGSFPTDVDTRDALSTILENTALFGDIILHLPDITRRVLNAHQEWDTMMRWSLDFANHKRHLLDNSTITMVHLVGQELDPATREPGYFNPYWSNTAAAAAETTGEVDDSQKKKIPRKEKRKKGPRITEL